MTARKEAGRPQQTAPQKQLDEKECTTSPDDLSSKRAKRIAKYREHIPEIYRPVYDRAISGRSYAAAVKARCLDCCAWQRTEVALCPAVECPSWSKRPYQKAPESEKPPKNGGFAEERNESDD